MSNELTVFQPVLARIAALSRDHLLAYRLDLGQLLLDTFYGGSAWSYRDQSPAKAASFAAFVATCAEPLADFGLSGSSLRNAINCRIAWDGLPGQVRESLAYTQVVEIARVGDPTVRAQLAKATVDGRWHIKQLKAAVGQVKAGTWRDTDAAEPGVQPPPPDPDGADRLPPPTPQVARLVRDALRWAQVFEAWQVQWRTVGAAKAGVEQREQALAGIAAARAKLGELARSVAKG